MPGAAAVPRGRRSSRLAQFPFPSTRSDGRGFFSFYKGGAAKSYASQPSRRFFRSYVNRSVRPSSSIRELLRTCGRPSLPPSLPSSLPPFDSTRLDSTRRRRHSAPNHARPARRFASLLAPFSPFGVRFLRHRHALRLGGKLPIRYSYLFLAARPLTPAAAITATSIGATSRRICPFSAYTSRKITTAPRLAPLMLRITGTLYAYL